MYSVRLNRRQLFIEEKCPTLEQMRLSNRLGQITPMPLFHRKSRERDRRYARDVVNQTVFNWLCNRPKSPKQKSRPRKQSTSPTKKRSSSSRQTQYSHTSTTVSTRRSTSTSRLSRGKSESRQESYASSFPTRITAEHVTLRNNNVHKDNGSVVSGSQAPSTTSVIENQRYSCEITMTYQADTVSPTDVLNTKRDEITIFQEYNHGYTSIVFKGYLKPGDTFAFKSQRSINERFELVLCINDLVDSDLSSCCEYQFQYGFRIGGENGLFWIQNIDGAKPCKQCYEGTDISSISQSVDDRMSVSSLAQTSSRLKLPMINNNRSKLNLASGRNLRPTSITKTIPNVETNQTRIITKQDNQINPEDFRRLSTSSGSTITSKPDNRPSTNFKPPEQKPNTIPLISESILSKDFKNIGIPTKLSSPSMDNTEKTAANGNESTNISSQLESTTNNTSLTQSLTTLIQQSMLQPDPPKTIPPRMMGDVENFTVAWLGPSQEADTIILCHVVNFVRVFYNIDTLNTFLTDCTHSKVIILLSYEKARTLIHQIYRLSCVYSIYLIATNEYEGSDWIKDDHGINGIYPNIRSLRDHLLNILPQTFSSLIPITINDTSLTDDNPFIYSQLLKETLIADDDESDLKKDLVEFCRYHYQDNPNEMNNIDKFENEFTLEKVLWWYTRNSFISKIINRGLRTQEVDLLYKMRYIIQSLHKRLKTIAIKEKTIVYALLDIPLVNAMKLQENINGFLQFGAFLPAMLVKPISVKTNNDEELISVMFTINLGADCGAKVKDLCHSDVNIDVLINFDTIFSINSITKINEKHWNVNIESVSHTDSQLKRLLEPLYKQIEAPVVLLQFCKLLLATNHYAECDYLAELLFTDESHRGNSTLLTTLAAVHHLLGNTDDENGHYKSACIQFFKSLRAFQVFLPSDHPLMSASYNNIGSMFFKDNQYNEAIQFHQKALDCQLKSASPDTDAIATYSNNIGAVYFEQGKYSEALKHLQRAATILEKLSPSEKILNLCIIYQKIAAIYWRMDKPKEALEYYKKTLDIQLVILPSTAHQISVTYFNLSTAYARLGLIDDAVMSAEKSVEQLLKIFPPDHPEVKENQAQLEIVRQKQWLQKVLLT